MRDSISIRLQPSCCCTTQRRGSAQSLCGRYTLWVAIMTCNVLLRMKLANWGFGAVRQHVSISASWRPAQDHVLPYLHTRSAFATSPDSSRARSVHYIAIQLARYVIRAVAKASGHAPLGAAGALAPVILLLHAMQHCGDEFAASSFPSNLSGPLKTVEELLAWRTPETQLPEYAPPCIDVRSVVNCTLSWTTRDSTATSFDFLASACTARGSSGTAKAASMP